MKCPTCGHGATIVSDSQLAGRGMRRTRECQQCGARFGTYEQPQLAMLMVRKRDGRREEFRRDKLLESLRLCARKRDLTYATLDAVVEDIETRLAVSGQGEVPSRVISEMAIGHLRHLDEIAYIRFASSYRHFVSLDDMLDELERLEYSPRPPAEQPALFADDLPDAPTPIASARSAASRG